jgi:hypothetical protein
LIEALDDMDQVSMGSGSELSGFSSASETIEECYKKLAEA